MRCRALLVVLLAWTAWAGTAIAESPPPRPGDVVFIGGLGGWADIGARFSASDRRYGHVGIVVGSSGGPMVIHASGAPGHGGAVTMTDYLTFTANAARIGLYRPLTTDVSMALTGQAVMHQNAATPFDDAFSLDTADAVYCTEFVWRTLSEALGEDAVPEKSDLYGTPVITLEDLQRAPHLRPVAHTITKAARE